MFHLGQEALYNASGVGHEPSAVLGGEGGVRGGGRDGGEERREEEEKKGHMCTYTHTYLAEVSE